MSFQSSCFRLDDEKRVSIRTLIQRIKVKFFDIYCAGVSSYGVTMDEFCCVREIIKTKGSAAVVRINEGTAEQRALLSCWRIQLLQEVY